MKLVRGQLAITLPGEGWHLVSSRDLDEEPQLRTSRFNANVVLISGFKKPGDSEEESLRALLAAQRAPSEVVVEDVQSVAVKGFRIRGLSHTLEGIDIAQCALLVGNRRQYFAFTWSADAICRSELHRVLTHLAEAAMDGIEVNTD